MADTNIALLPRPTFTDEKFSSDVLEFFSGVKAGHLGQWEYSEPKFSNDVVRGGELWRKFLREHINDYYILPNEIRLIQETAFSVAECIGKSSVTVIELGPGSKESVYFKTIPMLKGFLNPQTYVAIDLVGSYLKDAKRIVSGLFDGCNTLGIQKDFFNESFCLPHYDTPVMIMFGGTLCNLSGFPNDGFSIKETIKILRNIRSLIGDGGYFVITQDTNQDPISIERAYQGQGEFALNLMHRVLRDANVEGDFDPKAFEFKPRWFSKSYSLVHSYTVKRDMRFRINETPVELKENQVLYFNNSYKYPSELFKRVAAIAGFQSVRMFFDKDKRIALHVLKAA